MIHFLSYLIKVLDLFNTRELAMLIWIIIAFILMMLFQSIRESIISLAKIAFSKGFVKIYLWMLLYLSAIIYVLYAINLWDNTQTKNTIIWILFVGFPTLMNVNKAGKDKHFFRDAIKDIFRFTTILEFITGFYTFNLWAELIIIPIAVFMGVCLAVADTDKKYKSVKKILNGFLGIIGLCLIIYAGYKILVDFRAFATETTLKDFIVPPALSLFFLLFIYALSIYMRYETLFIVIPRALKNPELVAFAKKKALIHFHLGVKDAERWKTHLFNIKVTTKEELIASIGEIKKLKKIEKEPPKVDYSMGWSPYEAKDYLSSVGIDTGYYQNSGNDKWMAVSKHIKIESTSPASFISNNISYYVEGNNQIANRIMLSLCICSPDSEETAKHNLLSYSLLLYSSALGKTMPTNIQKAIQSGKNAKALEKERQVRVIREDWPHHKLKGYNLTLKIEMR
jgi:hypothetical protein